MTITPLVRQFFVAGSTHLAALSAGGVVAYPSVLIQQLKSNDSIIQLDLHNGSWIGSVHGFAGIPSIFLPLLMQQFGRKSAFIISCICIIIGWTIIFTAQNISTLIVGECFHGLGTNSLLAVSFLTISEIVQPKYRNTCLLMYSTVQIYGMTSVGIIGRFLHWKTIGLVMSVPVLLALPIGCFWPQSPSWLAFKGHFKECERTFVLLRGTDEQSQKELRALINFEKEKMQKPSKTLGWTQIFRETIIRKDFYLPTFHIFMLINQLYWGGGMPVIIYSSDMMQKITGKEMNNIKLIMDMSLVIGYNIALVVIRYWSSKKFMLLGMCGSAICMTLATIGTYFHQISGNENSYWTLLAVYSLVGFLGFSSLGSTCLGFSIASELMPVKHRGIGGSLYVIFTCVLHSTSLKAYPYLVIYFNLWGVFLIYALYTTLSIMFIKKYVPETRNKTLYEIEYYYIHGHFKKNETIQQHEEPFIKTEMCD